MTRIPPLFAAVLSMLNGTFGRFTTKARSIRAIEQMYEYYSLDRGASRRNWKSRIFPILDSRHPKAHIREE